MTQPDPTKRIASGAYDALVDAEIAPIGGGEVVRRDFIVLGKGHVRIAFPIEEIA